MRHRLWDAIPGVGLIRRLIRRYIFFSAMVFVLFTAVVAYLLIQQNPQTTQSQSVLIDEGVPLTLEVSYPKQGKKRNGLVNIKASILNDSDKVFVYSKPSSCQSGIKVEFNEGILPYFHETTKEKPSIGCTQAVVKVELSPGEEVVEEYELRAEPPKGEKLPKERIPVFVSASYGPHEVQVAWHY